MASGGWDATHTEMDAGVSDPTSTAGGQETPDVVAEEPKKSLINLNFVLLIDLQHANLNVIDKKSK